MFKGWDRVILGNYGAESLSNDNPCNIELVDIVIDFIWNGNRGVRGFIEEKDLGLEGSARVMNRCYFYPPKRVSFFMLKSMESHRDNLCNSLIISKKNFDLIQSFY